MMASQYEQDAYTQRWCVEHLQTSNELSPWDVSFKSPFILPGANNAQCFETPSLASAEDLIAYVSALECAAPFCRASGSQRGGAPVLLPTRTPHPPSSRACVEEDLPTLLQRRRDSH